MNKDSASSEKREIPQPSKKEQEEFIDLETELLIQISKAATGKRVMEAYLLGWSVIEQFMLPRLLKFVASNLKIEIPSIIAKLNISQIILLYYFLTHDQELYLVLERARKKRNTLIHHVYEQESWKKLKMEYKKSLKDIIELFKLFDSRFKGETRIPVLSLYTQGWNDGLDMAVKKLKNLS